MSTVALAGRRIDAPDTANRRFPLENAPVVERRLVEYFQAHGVLQLVCSAACGADLLALSAAEKVGISARTIVLPFEPASFRRSSVTDRPGDWGSLYDTLIAKASRSGTLVVLDLNPENENAYEVATHRIIEEAAHTGPDVRACLVWEGGSRGTGDHSVMLSHAARARGWPVDLIPTL